MQYLMKILFIHLLFFDKYKFFTHNIFINKIIFYLPLKYIFLMLIKKDFTILKIYEKYNLI